MKETFAFRTYYSGSISSNSLDTRSQSIMFDKMVGGPGLVSISPDNKRIRKTFTRRGLPLESIKSEEKSFTRSKEP